ncbi:MAG: ribonuclease III [Candidatus Zambryskibacteria bacterium RIFCSPLOWO2_02_FULL_51_21]|uniref:Ribonuclease 3 n=1 Tax=Candidatus Zambryskibacteria bacterium RIFCSPHIGHO2_02_FULL_43_37 TaxID=1802749 RepID=A0A1G2THB2_9BACT|nr:MAG: ribonuclease III [Candidatus Zambryskibacteria bacterium RIFCSPHIGHO2_01_FULL_52_18]OHA96694.1 MAG: ribonuclease III [Candidatus Zambryskibacteria bacterium RIFCSPHIGHO2_02_FULL_43_37]OHB06717.1 MAG: ribonuclease III [Candidatus Zambryskibacteria bacterium RIFCSPLOWO2_01_FULL_52_12]OHB11050.1 MAG: ribonuclease III [Candidatus Zambryskibacteria bacterium RIFCSPLOWO2_02_FULL_51_21]
MDFTKFEETAGVAFKNKALLKQAFTHRSYINENKASGLEHNERLEFLGDAVLELVITDHLFNTMKEASEGEMTSLRSALVNADTCAQVAQALGVNEYLLLSKGEQKDDTGRARAYILANTLEALIGALYVDQGYEAAKDFIMKHITPILEVIVRDGKWIDAKSLFQEKAQEHLGATPAYKTIRESGPDHDKHFTVEVSVGREVMGEGEGKSKQDAEQAAAKNALEAKGWK